MNHSTQPRELPEGVWQTLLTHAFTLVDEIARHGISDPFWTFGGGTVLMLRHGHRPRPTSRHSRSMNGRCWDER